MPPPENLAKISDNLEADLEQNLVRAVLEVPAHLWGHSGSTQQSAADAVVLVPDGFSLRSRPFSLPQALEDYSNTQQ